MSCSLLLQLICLLPFFTLTHAVYFDVNTCSEQTPCVHVAPIGNDANNGTISFPFRTVQRALNYANQTYTVPTTIVLADGTYPGNIVWCGRSVTLTSISGASSTFIDCEHVPNRRGIWIGSGESTSTIVSGITIQNCRNAYAGAMAIAGVTTKPTIKHVVFHNNSAAMGGGMLILFASPTLIGCNFTWNQGENGGALMATHNGRLIGPQMVQTLSSALNYFLPANTPVPAGETSFVNLTNCNFHFNFASGIGASYYLMAAYRMSCSHCQFTDGSARGSGAIGAGTRSNFSIDNSLFMNNEAREMFGGAISIQQGTTGTITNTIFTNNQAKQGGGGISMGSQANGVTVKNCQFYNNKATIGSMVYIDPTATGQVSGCTGSNNVAYQQGGIYIISPISAHTNNMSTNTFSNNVALGGYGADYGSFPGSLIFAVENSTSSIGSTSDSPSRFPFNVTRTMKRSINNLEPIVARILLLDTFGQRYDLINSTTDLYANIKTLDNNTVPALLVASTRQNTLQGVADVSVVVVGEAGATYAVTWAVSQWPLIEPIRLLVSILPCEPQSVITFYDQTTFPICNPAATHYISSGFFSAIVVLSCILIALVLIVQGLTIWFWSTPVFKTSTPLFMSLMLVGAIVGYLSVILSVIDVDRTSDGLSLFNQICKTQYWMMGVAFVLMFATLALKTWRIRNIFCNSQLTEIRTVNTFALFRWLLVLVALEMLIHLVWVSTDPLHVVMRLTGSRIAATCESDNSTAFLITNLVYKGVIALICVLFAYQTRDVTSRFNESRQLMIASYNMFVSVVVIATLSLALPDVDARRTVYAVGSLFVITSTWFVLFFPKLFVALFHPDQNTSLGIATGTGGSGNKNSNNSAENRKISGKNSHYQLQGSKTSLHNGNNNSSTASASASAPPSKATSPSNTAPNSPIMPAARLSLNLGTVRSSVSAIPTPVSPQLATAFVLRHLSIERGTSETPKIVMIDENNGEGVPELELMQLQQQQQQQIKTPSQPGTHQTITPAADSHAHGHGHGAEQSYRTHPQPAKNFV